MIVSFLVFTPFLIVLKLWNNYQFFCNHKEYKHLHFWWMMFYACRHVIDDKYGQLWHLNLTRDYAFDANDFRQWAMQDYTENLELNLDEQLQRECPICLIKFENNAMVIGLKCSKLHIYHRHCLEKMMNSRNNNCAFCRIKI